jgi:hypothetical protein
MQGEGDDSLYWLLTGIRNTNLEYNKIMTLCKSLMMKVWFPKILLTIFLHKFCHHRLAEYFLVFWNRRPCWSVKRESPRTSSLVNVIYDYLPPGYSSNVAWPWSRVAVSNDLPMDTAALKFSPQFIPPFHGTYKSMW